MRHHYPSSSSSDEGPTPRKRMSIPSPDPIPPPPPKKRLNIPPPPNSPAPSTSFPPQGAPSTSIPPQVLPPPQLPPQLPPLLPPQLPPLPHFPPPPIPPRRPTPYPQEMGGEIWFETSPGSQAKQVTPVEAVVFSDLLCNTILDLVKTQMGMLEKNTSVSLDTVYRGILASFSKISKEYKNSLDCLMLKIEVMECELQTLTLRDRMMRHHIMGFLQSMATAEKKL